jgi:type VI protein secretion system component VasF
MSQQNVINGIAFRKVLQDLLNCNTSSLDPRFSHHQAAGSKSRMRFKEKIPVWPGLFLLFKAALTSIIYYWKTG